MLTNTDYKQSRIVERLFPITTRGQSSGFVCLERDGRVEKSLNWNSNWRREFFLWKMSF